MKSPTITLHLILFISLTTLHATTALSLNINVPTKWRLNAQGQPKLCWVVQSTLKGLTRVGFGSPMQETRVAVTADSNRAILRGKLSHLSLTVLPSQNNNNSPKWALLPVKECLLLGNDLDFGWTPLLVTTLPLVLLLTRPPLFKLLSIFYLWKMVQKYRSQSKSKSKTNKTTTAKKPQNKGLLDYSLTWSNQNLRQSRLLKKACQQLLRSLLSNSVLPVIAAAGDSLQQNSNNNNNPQQQQLVQKNMAGELVVQPQAFPPSSNSNNSNSNNNNNNHPLTTLLSATKFELQGAPPLFQSNGWLELPSRAILPDSKGSLDFTLRTRPAAGSSGGGSSRIEFGFPQVQLDVQAVPLVIPKQFLPKVVWVPVGDGVAVDLVGNSGRISVDRLGISEGACRMDGRINLSSPDKGSAMVRRP